MLPVQISYAHKMIGVPATDAVRNLFPDAITMDHDGQNYLALPHRPVEAFLLRKHGYDVPSPIASQYDWPGLLAPFKAQVDTCSLLTMSNRAYVLNGMGTGKTRAALWAWDYLRSNGLCGKLLVLAPLSTLKFVWAREAFNTLSHRKCAVLHGTKKKRLEALASDAEIFILNHDGLKVLKSDLAARTDIDALVLDELAVYRNGTSLRSKTTRTLAARMKWVWGMTGSPIPNSPTDVWSQAQIVTPDNVPRYFGRFRDDLMIKINQFKFLPKPDAVERAYSVLQPAVRYTLDDVAELPDMVEQTVDVEMGPKQAKVYKAMLDHCHAMVQSQEITAANAGAAMQKLLQVSIGWVYTSDRGVVALDNTARITALIDAILSADRKVLVFVPFKHALAGISEALTSEGIEHATVSGDTAANDRSDIFNLFQNTDKYKVIAAHPMCLAHGLTLTAADTIIWFGPVTSLEIYEQANHRIRRVGQKHRQLVLHLQSTPVEQRIYKMLQAKQLVQDKLLDLFESASENQTY